MDSMANKPHSNQVFEDDEVKKKEEEEVVVVNCTSSSCGGGGGGVVSENGGICSICLEKIDLKEIALIKGCEHAYCVTCILRWATYNQNPSCPQCKHPFEFLIVHRSLDGSIHDYMFEESVCLLMRATWFIPLPVEAHETAIYEDLEDVYHYEDEGDDGYLDEVYFSSSSNTLRIGNRRWGDNGFVSGGRKEARPISREDYLDPADAGSSRGPKKKEAAQNTTGRRAKRALKREGADKAAAAVAASKHHQLLVRLGRLPKVVPPAAAAEKSET